MFAAIIMRGSRARPQDYASGEGLIAALTPFRKADTEGVWEDERALIAQAIHHNTPESLHERAPEVCAETGRVIAGWVRLDNREELCATLRLEDRPTLTDPQVILAAHREWGSDCAARLEGDFSFVIYDPSRQETYCARDSIGAKPFFYMLTDEVFIAATSVAAFRALKGVDLSPDYRWTAFFVLMFNYAHTQSAYEGVRKLAPAHDLQVPPDGQAEPREYFRFDLAAPHASTRDEKWVRAYREAFDHAVRVRARSAFLVGSESSGGLDSSSIAGTLVDMLPHGRDDFHCFGLLTFEGEPELMLQTAAMRGIRHSHILTTPEMLRIDAVYQRALTALGHPPEHWQMISHPSFFEMAEMFGIRTLHSGYGGDEVVTNHCGDLIGELWDRRDYRALFAEMPGAAPLRAARLAKLAMTGPRDPQAEVRQSLAVNFEQSCLSKDVLHDGGIAEDIEALCLPRHDFTLNGIAAAHPGFRVARSARLESASIYAATHGIEYRWPLYDRRLLQQFFATPSIEKRKGTMGRYLHRRAMAGRVPDTIRWQRSKDVGIQVGGRIRVQTPELIAFDDLPGILRTLIDRNAYDRRLNLLRNSEYRADERTINAHVFFWQVRQLVAWLDG